MEQLAERIGWTGSGQVELTWEQVEETLGIKFPTDFKELMLRFPSGAFFKRFYVISPVQNLRRLREFQQNHDDDLSPIREYWGDPFMNTPYPPYPETGGVIPWGRSDGLIFYWRETDPNPDNWPIVFTDFGFNNWGEYRGSASALLLKLLTGKFENPVFEYSPEADEYVFDAY